MRVENTKLVVEPGAGRTGRLASVAYHQFNNEAQYSLSPLIFSSKQVDGVPGRRISILLCLTPEKNLRKAF
jgi:hypothetical protein